MLRFLCGKIMVQYEKGGEYGAIGLSYFKCKKLYFIV